MQINDFVDLDLTTISLYLYKNYQDFNLGNPYLLSLSFDINYTQEDVFLLIYNFLKEIDDKIIIEKIED